MFHDMTTGVTLDTDPDSGFTTNLVHDAPINTRAGLPVPATPAAPGALIINTSTGLSIDPIINLPRDLNTGIYLNRLTRLALSLNPMTTSPVNPTNGVLINTATDLPDALNGTPVPATPKASNTTPGANSFAPTLSNSTDFHLT